jgi:hypothetical protein
MVAKMPPGYLSLARRLTRLNVWEALVNLDRALAGQE